MGNSIWILVAVVAVSTWLTRALPLILNLEKWVGEDNKGKLSRFFQLMGPALISALLVMSLDEGLFSFSLSAELTSTVAGFAIVTISYLIFRNIGLCIFAGIVAFALVFHALT